jgi:nitroimidazol reductase NimA-like FMN-containing flavoprotein (pyridoxamine 5'-phosphate oxidase superfamily)
LPAGRVAATLATMTTNGNAEIARELIDTFAYMVLGTADPDGRPWTTPVYYAPDGYGLFYWISSPDRRHSRNIADRPEVSIVIFDSTVPIGAARAVYMSARAEQVPDDEIEGCLEVAFRPRFPGIRPFTVAELTPPGLFRLYRARVTEHSILIRGGDPVQGTGADRRVTVEL